MSQPSKHELVREVSSRDALDWHTVLVRTHRVRLLSLARSMGLDAEASFDCVQEALQTFLLLPQARALASQPDDAARLLTVVTKNAARTLRRRVRTNAQRTDAERELDGFEGEVPRADARLEGKEALASLQRCVLTLSEQQRAVVTLRMLEELPGEEVAQALGITPQHVAVLLHRAKASLRGCMASEGYDDCDRCCF